LEEKTTTLVRSLRQIPWKYDMSIVFYKAQHIAKTHIMTKFRIYTRESGKTLLIQTNERNWKN
jgi:hypothetical protein